MSKFDIYQGNDEGEQKWRWRLIDSNGEKIARGGEPFVSESNAKQSIETLQEQVNANTPVWLDESSEDDDKGYRFEYFKGTDEQWYWKFRSGNNKSLAIGGEGFVSEANVKTSIENVKVEIPRAEVS